MHVVPAAIVRCCSITTLGACFVRRA